MPDEENTPSHPREARWRGRRRGEQRDPFCHVEQRRAGDTRHYVVHTESPRFVVEMEESGEAKEGSAAVRGVIRRVCVPNSWAGDYHRCARLLGAAVSFFESPARPNAP